MHLLVTPQVSRVPDSDATCALIGASDFERNGEENAPIALVDDVTTRRARQHRDSDAATAGVSAERELQAPGSRSRYRPWRGSLPNFVAPLRRALAADGGPEVLKGEFDRERAQRLDVRQGTTTVAHLSGRRADE